MRAFILGVALLSFAAVAHAAPARIERVDCNLLAPTPADARAECGFLYAPENRANPASREIAIPYLWAHSSAAHPAPDPLIIMTGGPGGRAMHPEYIGATPPLATRDVIWFEQRGTELARPVLACSEYEAAIRRALLGAVNGATLAREQIAAAKTCADRARAEGADLAGYTSAEIVADLEDLRRLLGFAKLNLYGVSYSGRVMMEMARAHPASVRSVFLNTPLPAEANYDEHGSANMRRTLNMVFDGCAADRVCAHAYPNLRSQFAQLVAQAARNPRRVVVKEGGEDVAVTVTDWVLANALLNQLYSPFGFEPLPAKLDAIARGDEAALASIVGVGSSGYAWTMRMAVWCNEEAPFEDKAAVARQLTDYPEFAGVDQSTVPLGACEAAGFASAAPAQRNEPVETDVPVLIVSGAFDAATPPGWQSAMAARLTNAQQAVLPSGGHAAGFYTPCAWELLDAFLARPGEPLGAACLLALREPSFAGSAR